MTNVFVLATEYHFLMAMCIIENNFSSGEYVNKLVLTFRRLNDLDHSNFPENLKAIQIDFDRETDIPARIRNEVFNTSVQNLFMVNVYRPLDTLIVSRAPRGTKVHLMQEGSLFYHRLEKSVFKHRVKEVFLIYYKLWRKGIRFNDLIVYGRYMETSGYVKEIWLTHPELYVGPKLKKKFNVIPLNLSGGFYDKIVRCFKVPEKLQLDLDGYLIYLSPIMRNHAHIPVEIEEVKKILENLRLSKVLIKLHPAASDKQLEAMKAAFGDLVLRNYIPAELYIAKAKNSVVVGCASTTLFYNNTTCKYFALKAFYQKLGIYATWKNIQLPNHVKIVDDSKQIRFLVSDVA